MIIIEREISEYTHHNIILGIFENIEIANKAKEAYIAYCKDNDKWGEQAYKEVNLNEDIILKDVSRWLDVDEKVIEAVLYVVSYFMEGFGQVTRVTEKIYTSGDEAKKFVDLKNTEEPEYEPCWYSIKVIEINKIYFDE